MPAKIGGERLRDSNPPPLPCLDLFFALLDKANMVVGGWPFPFLCLFLRAD